jgi:hypothetical protein
MIQSELWIFQTTLPWHDSIWAVDFSDNITLTWFNLSCGFFRQHAQIESCQGKVVCYIKIRFILMCSIKYRKKISIFLFCKILLENNLHYLDMIQSELWIFQTTLPWHDSIWAVDFSDNITSTWFNLSCGFFRQLYLKVMLSEKSTAQIESCQGNVVWKIHSSDWIMSR